MRGTLSDRRTKSKNNRQLDLTSDVGLANVRTHMNKFIACFVLLLSACQGSSPSVPANIPAPAPAPARPPSSTPAETTTPKSKPEPAPAPQPKQSAVKPAFMLETPSLYSYRTQEIYALTTAQIFERNDSDIAAFEAYKPGARASLKTGAGVSPESADAVIQATYSNPIVSPYATKYQRPDVQIGYCFGRATFAHLALKKMGLQTTSIRKLWLVGPMTAASVKWGFHVATAAFVEDLGWRVLDSNIGRIVSVRDWFDHYRYMSDDNRLRIYFTEPARFGVTIPHYDRVDLGLNLSAERDWYQHYFFDLMAWFRTANFRSLGLDHVSPASHDLAPSQTFADDIYAARTQKPAL
jgi:hypothetical protein